MNTTAQVPAHWRDITDAAYIAGLKAGNNAITESFFGGLCRYTLNEIRVSLMHGAIDYDELANELYLYLSAQDWRRLDTYAGLNGCSLRSWLVRTVWRFFVSQRERLLGDRVEAVRPLQSTDAPVSWGTDTALDVRSTLERMPNSRYAQVLTWLLLDGYPAHEVAQRLHTTTANVYNLKHRAVGQFIALYNGA